MPDRQPPARANLNQLDEMKTALRQFNAQVIDVIGFARRVCEFSFWWCPVTGQASVQPAVFTDEKNAQFSVAWTDEAAYASRTHTLPAAENNVLSMQSGEALFTQDYTHLSYFVFNLGSDNVVIFDQAAMYKLRGMCKSIKNERLLAQAHKMRDFYDVFEAFDNCGDWVWIIPPDAIKAKSFPEVVNAKGETVFPVFTAPDLAKQFLTTHPQCKTHGYTTSDFYAIDANALGTYILATTASKVVFNFFTAKEIAFTETDWLLRCFLVGFPARRN